MVATSQPFASNSNALAINGKLTTRPSCTKLWEGGSRRKCLEY